MSDVIFVGAAKRIPLLTAQPPDPVKVTASAKRPSSNGPSQAPSQKPSCQVSTHGPCIISATSEPATMRAHHASRGKLFRHIYSNRIATHPLPTSVTLRWHG